LTVEIHRAVRRIAAGLLGCSLVALAAPAAGAGPAWLPVTNTVHGIFDLGGPRQDGSLVVAGAGRLYLLDARGGLTPYAHGPGGYADDPGAEAYLAVSPGLQGPGCQFAAGDVFILRLHNPVGITRVDKQGLASVFANVTNMLTMNGIAFDTVGSFGYRLLVTGPSAGAGTAIDAIDCNGNVATITRSAPPVEGGIEVAPFDFVPFGGALVAPDELNGNIYAIAPDGGIRIAATPRLPHGQDIGVESVAFVPPGMAAGGDVFYSDRLTPGNPHPGTDTLLRLPSSDLTSAGAGPGDLLAATEGGATMVWVRCSGACTTGNVVSTPTRAHGEGHIAFRVQSLPSPLPLPSRAPAHAATPSRAASPSPWGPILATIAALVVLGVAVLVVRSRARG
jgi:hypothetical protein